jgi:SAM-dependent methyltransferase
MRERFERIYANNEWGCGSGEGSLPIHTEGYISLIQHFIQEREIRSVVDLGCGDWQFSKFIDWGKAHYCGYDIVRTVVENNQATYASKQVEFRLFSGDFNDLPNADLLIVKDVLQHWSNQAIAEFLPVLKRYPYSLVTNCVNPRRRTFSTDIDDGGFRYLDLQAAPFNLEATELLSFRDYCPIWLRPFKRARWQKKVLLIQNNHLVVQS